MTELKRDIPQFYLTAPSPCPYIEGLHERKIFTHLVGERASAMNNVLSQSGFRRSQNIAYKPACENCQRCVSVRVCVYDFETSRSNQRVMRKNRDVIAVPCQAEPTSEQFSLFRKYLEARHGDGGMADMTALDYAMMVKDTYVTTSIVEYRERDPDSGITGTSSGRLLAVSLTDELEDGLSMVYSFFDPDEDRRSLGTFIILDHIARARLMGHIYVYLGYWVKGSQKMDYKARFLPQERLGANGWVRVET